MNAQHGISPESVISNYRDSRIEVAWKTDTDFRVLRTSESEKLRLSSRRYLTQRVTSCDLNVEVPISIRTGQAPTPAPQRRLSLDQVKGMTAEDKALYELATAKKLDPAELFNAARKVRSDFMAVKKEAPRSEADWNAEAQIPRLKAFFHPELVREQDRIANQANVVKDAYADLSMQSRSISYRAFVATDERLGLYSDALMYQQFKASPESWKNSLKGLAPRLQVLR
jgi:hypothetical protein